MVPREAKEGLLKWSFIFWEVPLQFIPFGLQKNKVPGCAVDMVLCAK